MAALMLEERVTRLEDLMAEVWRAFAETDRRLDQRFDRTEHEIERLSREVREFKNATDTFQYEMGAFRDEMKSFRDAMYAAVRDMKKQWGDLSNKMGTMAEDLVAPSIPNILRTVVSYPDVEMVAMRLRRRHPTKPGLHQEYDVVAVCGEYVLINETKSSLNAKDVDDFIQVLVEAREFFPEHAGRHFIGAIASLYVDLSVVRHGQNRGVLVLGFGEDLMDVLNDPGFVPRRF
jgi:hypothetical protein